MRAQLGQFVERLETKQSYKHRAGPLVDLIVATVSKANRCCREPLIGVLQGASNRGVAGSL